MSYRKIYILSAGLLLLSSILSAAETPEARVVHVYVALCDNESQNIAPVAARIGNGDDAENNLYWGAYYGIKAFFMRSPNWELIETLDFPKAETANFWDKLTGSDDFILQRCIFRHVKYSDVYMVADAYRGKRIKKAMKDFFKAAAGVSDEKIMIKDSSRTIEAQGKSQLVTYIGHDGLMDFSIRNYPKSKDNSRRDAIMLSCFSKRFFEKGLRKSGANPLLWTTGFMAPEAYTLELALEGWILNETPAQIHERAAIAYNSYQKCGLNPARRLFATGF